MNENTVVARFYELAAEAERVDSASEQPLEPAMDAVLAHVVAHPEAREAFRRAFVEIIRDPQRGPPELVEYCMHALRWPEARSELAHWLESESSERLRHVLRKVVMAFDDDWPHAKLYSRFGG